MSATVERGLKVTSPEQPIEVAGVIKQDLENAAFNNIQISNVGALTGACQRLIGSARDLVRNEATAWPFRPATPPSKARTTDQPLAGPL
jgi:stage V sporulation protein SpoVS